MAILGKATFGKHILYNILSPFYFCCWYKWIHYLTYVKSNIRKLLIKNLNFLQILIKQFKLNSINENIVGILAKTIWK